MAGLVRELLSPHVVLHQRALAMHIKHHVLKGWTTDSSSSTCHLRVIELYCICCTCIRHNHLFLINFFNLLGLKCLSILLPAVCLLHNDITALLCL